VACFHTDVQVFFLNDLEEDFFGPEELGRVGLSDRARGPWVVALLLSHGSIIPQEGGRRKVNSLNGSGEGLNGGKEGLNGKVPCE